MSKIKMPRKSPSIDMTPMVDLFTLLLTFFMLTTNFKPSESVQVDTPNSISEKPSPDKNIMTIAISKDNRVFFNIDNGKDTTTQIRKKVLAEMGKRYKITFSPTEIDKFSKLASWGVPMKDFQKWLTSEDEKEKEALNTGIPIDSADNQLNYWILYSRLQNPDVEAAIKGDADADYKTAKKVFDILQDNKVDKFNLTTNLEKVEIKLAEIKQ